GFGQLRLTSAAALEKGHAEIALQQSDRGADGRLRASGLPCRCREGAALGGTNEQLQLIEIPVHGDLSCKQIGNDFIPSWPILEWRPLLWSRSHARIPLSRHRHCSRSGRHHLDEGYRRLQ